MYFEELSIEEKVEATISYFKSKDEARIKGQKDADAYIKKTCRKKARIN